MKKIEMKKIAVKVFVMFALLATPSIYAQPGFEEDVDDGEEDPATPIDDYLIYGIAGAAALGYTLLKKGEKIA